MKKGFTLIELLAVIIILGLIGLIVIPSITKLIRESRENLYTNQVRMIEESARKWGIANTDILSETENNYLSLSDLINAGFIEQDEVKDPRDSKTKMKGCIIITYNNQKSKYVYKYSDDECSASNLLVNKFEENNPGFGEYTLLYGENYFVGEDPNNWLQFGNALWRVLKDSDEGIKIIFERMCSGISVNTCASPNDGNISFITNAIYEDVDSESTNKWNSSPNYYQQALDGFYEMFYEEVNFDKTYIQPINWCIGAIYYFENFNELRNSECQDLSDDLTGTGDYDGYTDFESPIGLFTLTDVLLASNSVEKFLQGNQINESYLHKEYTFLTGNAISFGTHSYNVIRSNNVYGVWQIRPDMGNYWTELRPVINLRADVLYESGEGTESNPYVLGEQIEFPPISN